MSSANFAAVRDHSLVWLLTCSNTNYNNTTPSKNAAVYSQTLGVEKSFHRWLATQKISVATGINTLEGPTAT